jgi:hypothetical protein
MAVYGQVVRLDVYLPNNKLCRRNYRLKLKSEGEAMMDVE